MGERYKDWSRSQWSFNSVAQSQKITLLSDRRQECTKKKLIKKTLDGCWLRLCRRVTEHVRHGRQNTWQSSESVNERVYRKRRKPRANLLEALTFYFPYNLTIDTLTQRAVKKKQEARQPNFPPNTSCWVRNEGAEWCVDTNFRLTEKNRSNQDCACGKKRHNTAVGPWLASSFLSEKQDERIDRDGGNRLLYNGAPVRWHR